MGPRRPIDYHFDSGSRFRDHGVGPAVHAEVEQRVVEIVVTHAAVSPHVFESDDEKIEFFVVDRDVVTLEIGVSLGVQ